jgi:hypothetical protein
VVKKKVPRRRRIRLSEFVSVHTVEFEGHELRTVYLLCTTTLALIILLQLLYVRF